MNWNQESDYAKNYFNFAPILASRLLQYSTKYTVCLISFCNVPSLCPLLQINLLLNLTCIYVYIYKILKGYHSSKLYNIRYEIDHGLCNGDSVK